MAQAVSYDMMEHIATLDKGRGRTLEFNKLFLNGVPCYDLRQWRCTPDGSKKPMAGVTITEGEMQLLQDAYAYEIGETSYAMDAWCDDPQKLQAWREAAARREAYNARRRKKAGKEA